MFLHHGGRYFGDSLQGCGDSMLTDRSNHSFALSHPFWLISPQWRHNGHDGVSNHQPYDCLLNHLFRCRSKKTSKLHITGLCAGNSLMTSEFPAQMASNVENVSIWWSHQVILTLVPSPLNKTSVHELVAQRSLSLLDDIDQGDAKFPQPVEAKELQVPVSLKWEKILIRFHKLI